MPSPVNLVSVVGARPQFVKLDPVARAFAEIDDVRHRIVHTGQHFDTNMSDSFFDLLALPQPDVNLAVQPDTQSAQTADMMRRLETWLAGQDTQAVIVYGDTNSTLAATLVASKMQIPVAHVEAGLRSFDRRMPEEINRLVADHCGDRLYAPTAHAMQNLRNENLQSRSVLVGDVMLDAVLRNGEIARRESEVLQRHALEPGTFCLATVHRASNTGKGALSALMDRLAVVVADHLPVVMPVHPRTRKVLEEMAYSPPPNLLLLEPLSYLDALAAIQAARLVLTDSGGVQKEAAFLGTTCCTLREETEWTETVDLGVNQLVGHAGARLLPVVEKILQDAGNVSEDSVDQVRTLFGGGRAAGRIATDCLEWLNC